MKKKTTSTALVIPQTITPKPTKNDIINAMVERARVKHNEERDRLRKLREASMEKIKEAAKVEFQKNPPKPDLTVLTSSYYEYVQFEFRVTSPELKNLMKEHEKIGSLRPFDEKEVRAFIREGMSTQTGNAVQSLLANPDAVKALDASLEHIGM